VPEHDSIDLRRRRRSTFLVTALVAVNVGVAAFVAPIAVASDGGGAEPESESEAASGSGSGSEDAASDTYLMDPQVIETGDGSWAVGSSVDGVTMPLMELADDGTAHQAGGALTSQPAWASQGFVGPSVVEDGGTWWLFFAAQATNTGRYCLGAATTSDVSAGFEPSDAPLRCADDRDLVDPSAYQGDDGVVLAWAERTAAATSEATDSWRIGAAPLDLEDATLGDASVLLEGTPGGWEAGVVDAPSLVDVGDALVLLYGGNQWGSQSYAAGRSRSPSTSPPATSRRWPGFNRSWRRATTSRWPDSR
jgi:arabinan endo-1,5-alpha-L-arabinosidase